jgi:DNA primase
MNTNKITIEEAKQMNIIDYLASLNLEPQKINGDDYWYLSPLRDERTPSFKISRKLNLWYDHGIGKGGNIIDFGIRYFDCSVADFLEKLTNKSSASLSFHQQPVVDKKAKEVEKSKLKIKAVKDISNLRLTDFIKSRCVSIETARKYLKEVVLELDGKQFDVLGLKNISGGFEIRGIDNFKSSVSPKDYSLIENGRPALAVVEGMFDFLSLVDENSKMVPEPTDWLVLNSLSFLEKAMETMENYGQVYLLLDNDTAGKNAMKRLLSLSPRYQDLSHKYENSKDPNEWLVKEKTHEVKHIRKGFRM